jgi:hypothetical protein
VFEEKNSAIFVTAVSSIALTSYRIITSCALNQLSSLGLEKRGSISGYGTGFLFATTLRSALGSTT